MNTFSFLRPQRCLVALVAVALAATIVTRSIADDSVKTAEEDSANATAATAREEADTPSPLAITTTGAATGSSANVLAAPGAPARSAEAMERASAAAETKDAMAARIVDRLLGENRRAEVEARRLSLAEAVHAAVANNPGIRSQAEIPNASAWRPFGATGAFDPKFRASANAGRTDVPSGSALASGLTTFKEQSVRTGVSISKLLRSGANVDLTWTSDIIDTNSLFFTINNRYDNRLNLTLRQPLLRNFWASEENTTVLVARSQAEQSLATFEANLSRFVSGVIDMYWRYLQAAADLEVSRRSIALAQELVRDAEAKVDVGLLAPVAVKEAQADAAARQQRAIVIENALLVAGRDLQHEVMLGALENKAPEPVLPVEEHVVEPVELDRATSMKTAIECRAEIRGASYALERSRLEEKRAKNQTLPDLDFVANYGVFGLSGGHTYEADGTLRPSPYYGDYGDSLSDMFGNDFNDYAIGLELEVPFGNADAKARLAEAGINVRRSSRDLEQTISTVTLDVDRAIADVSSAAKRVVAAKLSRDLAEENLRNQQRRFELGAVTTKDVLDFQEKLAQAMAAEVGAITDHARSVTRLRVADGTLLARFGIEIRSPDAPDQPWWYLF